MLASKTMVGALGAGGAIYVFTNPDLKHEVQGKAKGAARFSRAFFQSCLVSFEYKNGLRGLKGEDYEKKKVEIHLKAAQRLLKVCLLHGGVYTKFGQHIASMNHVLPSQFTETLSVLQDKNPSVDIKEIEKTIESELGGPISNFFSEFDETAIAAASLAQVHRAVTKEGNEVAVKLQYPGLENDVLRDIWTMRLLARAMGYIFPEYEYTWLFPEFEDSIKLELDFIQEGLNSERVARMFEMEDKVHVPGIHWDYTTKYILTMDFIRGIKITDRKAIEFCKMDPKKVAETVTKAFGEMIYFHGFLHCDPHPGNLMVREMPKERQKLSRFFRRCKEHQVVLLDHGMYRRLDPAFRLCYCNLWKAFLTRDHRLGVEQAKKLGLQESGYDFLSLILTWRPSTTSAPIDSRISEFERQKLKDMYKGLINSELINSFLESLPRDMLFVMRTGDLVRGINKDLGGTTSKRLICFGEAAIKGINLKNPGEHAHPSYAKLKEERTALLQLTQPYADINQLVSSEMGFRVSTIGSILDLAKMRSYIWIAESIIKIKWWLSGNRGFTTRDIG